MEGKYWVLAVIIPLAALVIGLFVSPKPTATSTEGPITVVKQSGGVGLLAAECADESYITEKADYIIEGTVEKVESKWSEERTLFPYIHGTIIFTYTDLEIERYIKGEPFTENKLRIVTPGGEMGENEISLAVEDQPIFHEGKKVRIYFREENGEFSIVCGFCGVKEISSTGALVGGNDLGVTRVLPDIQYQSPGKPVSLQEAKEKVPYFRMPSYLPEGVTVKEVRILEVVGGDHVIVNLSSENLRLVIYNRPWLGMDEKKVQEFISTGYNDVTPKIIRINGNVGFAIEYGTIDSETGRIIPATVSWFDGTINYGITGELPLEYLMKMAESMY